MRHLKRKGTIMVNLMPIILCTIGFCNTLGQNQEKKMLDSLLDQFVTDTKDPMGLHRSLSFLGLPSNLDISGITFTAPIKIYRIIGDTSRMKSKGFKIDNIITPTGAWKVPFKYNGRYISSLTIEKIEGKYVVGDIKQNDTAQWIKVDKHVGKDKRRNTKLLRYRNLSFLHFPEIDEYNMFPQNTHYDLDTISTTALNSPLKLNTDKIREQFRNEIFEESRSIGARKMK